MQAPDSAFRLHLTRLNELIRDGGSLSGHERNCAFLNLRGGRFATISAVSGMDFDDDGRTPALVDWDRDGDLDLWIANRTAPQLRLVRNDSTATASFLGVRLVGTRCNRDAVGARVEVRTAEQPGLPLLKTVKAGEGFLGQSSKWVHFGLGGSRTVQSLRVRWPGGDWEEFGKVKPNGWYRLRQGREMAERVRRTTAHPPLSPRPLEFSPAADGVRIVLSAPVPAPRLPYQGREGAARVVDLTRQHPTVLNLWASWCGPCLKELQEWTRAAAGLDAAGIDIYAIATDDIDDHMEAGSERAWAAAELLGLPFHVGVATPELYARLEQLCSWPFHRQIPFSLPTSLLFDRHGRLAIIYRGPVSADMIAADVALLDTSRDALQTEALPFAGRWSRRPRPARPIQTAIQLMDRGDVGDAADFVRRNFELLAPHREFGLLAAWLGDEYIKGNQTRTAIRFYELAIRRTPDNPTILNNLAWQLAAHHDESVRDPARAVRYAERALELIGRENPAVLATLAVACAAAGDFDRAQRTALKARQLALQAGDKTLADKMAVRLRLFRDQEPYRDPAP